MKESAQAHEEFLRLKRELDSAAKLLRELVRLEQALPDHLLEFRARVAKLGEAVDQLGRGPLRSLEEKLLTLLGQYREVLARAEENLAKQFGVALQRELEQRGCSLGGSYPELKVGLLRIEIDFGRQRATLWYGPKQERLAICRLRPREVADGIGKASRELGSHLDEKEFMQRLKQAYVRARDGQGDGRVAIIKVLSELAHLLQSPQFHLDPRRENYRGYGRADFSYDLFRMRGTNQKLKLVVATRAYTRHRRDFLWIPDNDQGEGTCYSHVQLEEG